MLRCYHIIQKSTNVKNEVYLKTWTGMEITKSKKEIFAFHFQCQLQDRKFCLTFT